MTIQLQLYDLLMGTRGQRVKYDKNLKPQLQNQPFADALQKLCNIERKTPVLEYLFHKVAGLKTCNFIKKRLLHRCFPVNIAKLLRTAFFIEHLWWLLLQLIFNTQIQI